MAGKKNTILQESMKANRQPAPKGNKYNNKVDSMTDEEMIDIREKYYQHLRDGYVLEAFSYKISYKTLEKLIIKRPDIFTPESLDQAKAERLKNMIDIGLCQAKGLIEKGNHGSWKFLMSNMFKWSDRSSTEAKHTLAIDEFQQAVSQQDKQVLDDED